MENTVSGISVPSMWSDALAHLRGVHAAGGRVNYIGGPADSITEGVGASSRDRGWWSLFARTMAGALGQPTRAIGSAEISPDATWPVWKTSGPPPSSTQRSLGRHGMAIMPGTVVNATQPCDRFRLLFDETTHAFRRPGGTLEIRIDGEVADRIDCSHSDVVGRIWDSGPLGPFRPRSVEIECVAGGFVSIGHSYFHDGSDGTTGALFWRNAHAGFTAGPRESGFANPNSTWTGALTRDEIVKNLFSDRVVYGGGAIEPDCFLCCTGTNDVAVLDHDRHRIAAAYEQLVDYIRQRCGDSPSIGFIVPTASTRCRTNCESLFDGIHDACLSAGAFMIDLLHGVGTHADESLGYYHDGFHPNDRGHAAWAEYVSTWLLGAIRPGAPTAASG